MKIKIKKLRPNAVLPTRKDDDVGFDLYSVVEKKIKPGQVERIPTGIAVADRINPINDGAVWFPKIEGRSSLAGKGIFPVGGIIDPGYRGEIVVVLYNSTKSVFDVRVCDRVAQMVIYSALGSTNDVKWECSEVDCLVTTERGANGFGSTGV